MNNLALMAKIKQKQIKNNSSLSQNNDMKSKINEFESNSNYNNIDPNDPNQKYNPDVKTTFNQIYDYTEKKRKPNIYTYTTDIWKPIIGSINKSKIKEEDFIINIQEVDYSQIKSKYEIELEEREKEKLLAKQMAEKFAEENGLNNKSIMDDIHKPILLNNNTSIKSTINELSDINNTFIELKNISKTSDMSDTNNVDNKLIIESMTKLDDLINSIQNL